MRPNKNVLNVDFKTLRDGELSTVAASTFQTVGKRQQRARFAVLKWRVCVLTACAYKKQGHLHKCNKFCNYTYWFKQLLFYGYIKERPYV